MPHFSLLPFPSAVVGARPIKLENDFKEQPIAAAFAEDGSLFVLAEIFYNAYRYSEPESHDLHAYYILRYAPGLASPSVQPLEEITRRATAIEYNSLADLACLRSGELVLAGTCGGTWVTDARGEVQAASEAPSGPGSFAARAHTRPDGRLLVAMRGAGSHHVAVCSEDGCVLALTEEPAALDAWPPRVRALTTIGAVQDKLRNNVSGAWLGQLAAVSSTRFAASIYAGRYTKNSEFSIALLDDSGAVHASLDLDGDTPYVDQHLEIVGDPRNERVAVLTTPRLHVFDADGRPIARVRLDAAAGKPLSGFHLLAASPLGELLFVHRKHRTLLMLDAANNAAALEAAVATGVARYKTDWSAAKKAHRPINHRWVMPSAREGRD